MLSLPATITRASDDNDHDNKDYGIPPQQQQLLLGLDGRKTCKFQIVPALNYARIKEGSIGGRTGFVQAAREPRYRWSPPAILPLRLENLRKTKATDQLITSKRAIKKQD
eukprot:2888249-Pleurochrysis_carterae.AAC.14